MFKAIIKTSAIMGLALGATFVTPVERAQASGFSSFGKDCGGLNQKTCITLNKSKRCNKGLIEKKQSGRNICVRPSSPGDKTGDCGGLNEKTCITPIASKRCDAGLVEKRQRGRNICVRPSTPDDKTGDCGALNQETCISLIPAKRCDAGLVEQKQRGRNICVRPSTPGDKTGGCGGLNQKTCISTNPAKWCDKGLTVLRQPGRNICIRKADLKPGSDQCGGLNQQRCNSINPAKWCDEGFKNKIRFGKPDICIEKITNKDRLEVASAVIQELGDNNPLADLTKCLNSPGKIGDLKTAVSDRSQNGVFSLIRSCGTSLEGLQNMGKLSTLNDGTEGGNDRKFKTVSITVGASGAAAVAGSAGAGIVIELQDDPNARWYFTGGIGGGPKAEVVGDVTVGLSRSEIPSARWGFDHGIGAVVSGHYIVGLSGGVEFEGNSLSFAGISFGAGGGVGVGGAVYKTGAIFPFKDY